MRYSNLFGKTTKKPPTDATAISHKLLVQAGFIRESTAGRYYFLPLGIKVQNKIIDIVRDEMDNANAQELIAPIFHPFELWQETNRNNAVGFELTTLTDRRGAKFVPGGTAEEMMVDLTRKFQISYRDLPFNIYQFSPKFRDEMRARGGLLRVREFIMKDAYSFHATEEDFRKEYQNMWDTYLKIYNRLGLQAHAVPADNGYIGGDYCHEFIVESPIGESTYFVSEDGVYQAHEDIAQFTSEEINSDEALKDMQIVEQPKWVQTMEDNEKHYGKPKSHFLKNVVYKNRTTEEIIIATIRGDLNVNKTKLEHVLDAVGELEDATDEDLEKIGTKTGYVHSWGHPAKYVGDLSLKTVRNFIGGQKEDTTDSINVNYGRDFECDITADIALAQDGYLAPDGKSKLIEKRGIEVGNIFSLGTHYSTRMKNATFTDGDGAEKPYIMGCYGLGIGRTLATIVETHSDERGIVWPEAVAPYQVHLIGLDLNDQEIEAKINSLYETLIEKGIEVLYDDRDVRAGEKFADADLIGIPHRIVISKRTADKLEYKHRTDKESQLLTLPETLNKITP